MIANGLRICAALLMLCAAMQAHAGASFVIVPGQGLDDGTPTDPVAGNPGTTLGAQRQYVFQKAADQWGAVLNSVVAIRVEASMDPDQCTGNSAVLGSGFPISLNADFVPLALPDTWYVIAQANAMAHDDLDPANNDITLTMNANIDNGCLTGTTGWWYGVDPAVPVPADKIPLLPLVIKQMAHGLGFISLTDPTNGDFCCDDNQRPDVWSWYMRDAATGKLWIDMEGWERFDSAANDPNLTWVGRNVNRMQGAYLGATPLLKVNSPPAIAGNNPVAVADFGPALPKNAITGSLVLAADGSTAGGGTVNDGCEPLTNAAQMAGNIALVERGICQFVIKVKNAQNAGALAVIVQNNVDPDLPPLGGADPTITIPTIGITQAVGTSLRANLAGGVNVTLGDPTKLAGTQGGCLRLNAPNPATYKLVNSTFTSDVSPRLLMRQNLFIERSMYIGFDLTLDLLKDIGWKTNPDEIVHADGFESNPCPFVVP